MVYVILSRAHFWNYSSVWPVVISWLEKPSADETETDKKEIPVDDLSPISCNALFSKLLKHFRIRKEDRKQNIVEHMVATYYFRILFYAYIVLVLNYAFFLEYLTEADAKNTFPENALFYYVFDIRSSKLHCLIPVIILFVILPAIFIFFTAYASEEIEREISKKVFKNLNVFLELHLNSCYNSYQEITRQARRNLENHEPVNPWSYRAVKYLKKKVPRKQKNFICNIVLLFVYCFCHLSYFNSSACRHCISFSRLPFITNCNNISCDLCHLFVTFYHSHTDYLCIS